MLYKTDLADSTFCSVRRLRLFGATSAHAASSEDLLVFAYHRGPTCFRILHGLKHKVPRFLLVYAGSCAHLVYTLCIQCCGRYRMDNQNSCRRCLPTLQDLCLRRNEQQVTALDDMAAHSIPPPLSTEPMREQQERRGESYPR